MSSPEQLDDYIHVSNPSVWMVLGAILLLIVAGIVWASVGTIAETAPAAVVSDGDSTVVCYVDQNRASEVSAGDELQVETSSGTVTGIVTAILDTPLASSSVIESEVTLTASDVLTSSSWVIELEASVDGLETGAYEATVVTAAYHPMALLFGESE